MTSLVSLRNKKAWLEKELKEIDKKIEEAEDNYSLSIASARYDRIVAALKKRKPFIIRLNPDGGAYYNLVIVTSCVTHDASSVFA